MSVATPRVMDDSTPGTGLPEEAVGQGNEQESATGEDVSDLIKGETHGRRGDNPLGTPVADENRVPADDARFEQK